MLPTPTAPLMGSGAAGLAIDAQSLTALKRQAKDAPQEATRKAATQFEALFMGMLLKSMRETLPGSDPLSSESAKTYTGMLDTQLSQKLADKGLGLADMIVKHLERSQSKTPTAEISPASAAATTAGGVSPAAATPAAGTPQDFVTRMRSQAQEAARTLGVPADFIVGQAALETGWGKHEIKQADGSPSFNLFGIKAGANWTGRVAEVSTTEYVDGVARKTTAKFRAYDSYEASFKDYSQLITKSPRYAQAIQQTGSALAFASSLQKAGYATDPDYAAKLSRAINTTAQLQRQQA